MRALSSFRKQGTKWSYFLTPYMLPQTMTSIYDWNFQVYCFKTHCLFANGWWSSLSVRKWPVFVLVGTQAGPNVRLFPLNFRSYMLFLRIFFAAVLIWTWSLKEHPNTLMATVHRDPSIDGWRSPLFFQLPRNTLGEVLVRWEKVWRSSLINYFLFVHGSFFCTKNSMSSMILAIWVMGVYSLVLNSDQKGWIFELAIILSLTAAKGLIFF